MSKQSLLLHVRLWSQIPQFPAGLYIRWVSKRIGSGLSACIPLIALAVVLVGGATLLVLLLRISLRRSVLLLTTLVVLRRALLALLVLLFGATVLVGFDGGVGDHVV